MESIWKRISDLDMYIQTNETFKLIGKNQNDATIQIQTLLLGLIHVAIRLRPFLPETAKKMEKLIKENRSPETPLFPRKD
jgi:methionyl-tRNA synthetase